MNMSACMRSINKLRKLHRIHWRAELFQISTLFLKSENLSLVLSATYMN
uniref:Uncharacterized protein n=1 Tax=Arundo donax TaxID=35708 RepID=A0A0A8Y7P8_ARUDO